LLPVLSPFVRDGRLLYGAVLMIRPRPRSVNSSHPNGAKTGRCSECKPQLWSTRCHRALHQALAAYRPTATFDQLGYLTDVRDNFLPGIELEDIRSDFEAGAGRELKGKMRAPHSSSALAVNTFGRWSEEPSSLCICGQTAFESLKFEQLCSTGLGGTAPHLDVLAVGPEAVVAVESKCLEHLQ